MSLISEWMCRICGNDTYHLSGNIYPSGSDIPKICDECGVMFEDANKFNAYNSDHTIEDVMVKSLRDKGYIVKEPSTIFLLRENYKGASKPCYSLRTTTRGFGVRARGCPEFEYVEIDPETLKWVKHSEGI